MSSFLLCGPCSASVSSSSLLLSSRRHATNDGSNSFSTVLATQNQRKPAGKSNAVKIVSMGNVNEGGVFAPLVVAIRPIIGVKRFNQLRGKAISLHSQVIGDFCSEFGATTKQRQKLIKTAKANGGRLGFLAWCDRFARRAFEDEWKVSISVLLPRNRNDEMHVICKREKRGMRKREREREMCCVVISFTIITTKQNLLLKLKKLKLARNSNAVLVE